MNLTQADKNKLEKCCPHFDIFFIRTDKGVQLFVIDPSGTRSHPVRSESLHVRLYAELAERITDCVSNKSLYQSKALFSLTLKELYHIARLYQRRYAQQWLEPHGFCRYEVLSCACPVEHTADEKNKALQPPARVASP